MYVCMHAIETGVHYLEYHAVAHACALRVGDSMTQTAQSAVS